MIVAKPIDWQPIANMPADRRDGRRLLLWNFGGPVVVSWSDAGGGRWDTCLHQEREDADGNLFYERAVAFLPTYWAEINPPA